jgi:hypothetical protein
LKPIFGQLPLVDGIAVNADVQAKADLVLSERFELGEKDRDVAARRHCSFLSL